MSRRSCSPCTLCCIVKGIKEIPKCPGESCENLSSNGCNIHGEHPVMCRAYECAWMQGLLPEGDRPDLIGAVFDLVSCPAGVHPSGLMVQCSSLMADRSPIGRTRQIVDTFLAKDKIVLLSGPPGAEGTVLYPDGVIEEFSIPEWNDELAGKVANIPMRPYDSYVHAN